jgi:hypothetical protein
VWTRHNVEGKLQMWIRGQTGYPFCDSFMRELAATGYAVHCGRECVAWFLVRDLRLDWRLGAEYFEHILIDYEVTANWGNWAYRVVDFHPTDALDSSETLTEDAVGGLKTVEMLHWAWQHDPHAVHVKTWLPELSPLPAKVALEPWRLLMSDLSPVMELEFECNCCTLLNHKHELHCVACGAPRSLGEYCGFVFGSTYPPPFGMSSSCLPPVNTHTKLFTNGPQPRARTKLLACSSSSCSGRNERSEGHENVVCSSENQLESAVVSESQIAIVLSQTSKNDVRHGGKIKPRATKKKKNRLQTDIGQSAY